MAEPTKTKRLFRSWLWRGFAIVWAVFAVFMVGDLVRHGLDGDAFVPLAWLAFISVIVWMVGWRPLVRYDDDLIEIRNPARTALLPWNTVTRVDAKDALRVHTKTRTVRSFAVVRSGAVANLVRSSRRVPADITGPERVALQELAVRSPIDYLVEVLRDQQDRRRNASNGEEQVFWAMPELIALGVTAVLVIIAIVTG